MKREREGLTVGNQRPLIQFDTITLTNNNHETTTCFHTGEMLQATITYTTHGELDAPRLEVAIYHDERVLVYRDERPLPPPSPGKTSTMSVLFPALPLLPEVYRLQTAVYDHTHLITMREHNFTVEGDTSATAGLIAIPTKWQ